MKKKLLAVAVAGALAAPGLALAQSSVTISGIFKVSLESYKVNSPGAGRAGLNTSETRVSDDSSRIIFNVVEDLGGGMQAIGQADMRIPLASGRFIDMSGNTHVGLRSKSMGRIFIGRQDVHYVNTESNLTSLAGDLRADSVSLLAFMRDGTTAIAGATRTPNIIHYTTPNWGGFTMIAGYSTGPAGAATAQPTANGVAAAPQQADLTTGARKGRAFVLNPNYEAANWQVGYSYWSSRPDITAATAAAVTVGPPAAITLANAGQPGTTLGSGDQRSSKLYGSFKMAGFKVGLSWDKSRVRNAFTGADIGNRTAWSLPVGYVMGNNQFHFHYTKARDDKVTAAQDGARMLALSYQYTLSKRTSVGVTYAKINNDAAAAYNLFTTSSLGNSAGAGMAAGEDPRIFAGTLRHAF